MIMCPNNSSLSIRKQCTLLSIARSAVYVKKRPKAYDTILANEIHEIWHAMPFYGYRRITAELQRRGYSVNHKKVARLMKTMNIQALYPQPRTSKANPEHKIYPYLLTDLAIVRPNQVWATDITYIKMHEGFMYLVGLIDLFSRFIVSWAISNILDTGFCLTMLEKGLAVATPEIINSDQGAQFTSIQWVNRVEQSDILVSMDGKGRWIDNVFIERFWRTLKYEHVLLYDFDRVSEATESIAGFIDLYNTKRLHQSLGYKTPAEVYWKK